MIARFVIGAAASAVAGRVIQRYSQPGAVAEDRERLMRLQQEGRERVRSAATRVREEAAGAQTDRLARNVTGTLADALERLADDLQKTRRPR